jgi:5'-deoxynucleotidase YfbR-like HD superfamily hydrolase
MEIKFTNEQYKTLLQLLYFGEWVANSYKTKEDKLYKESDALEQYIFSFASKFGLDNLIEYDDSIKKFVPTITMEEKFHPLIDKYNRRQIELLND